MINIYYSYSMYQNSLNSSYSIYKTQQNCALSISQKMPHIFQTISLQKNKKTKDKLEFIGQKQIRVHIIIRVDYNYKRMSQTRVWTEYEQKILKHIRDEQGIQKWSTIAQKMAEDYGIKGRNGKQCKQRYMEVFDQKKEVLYWDYEAQQTMFQLHDKLGNKWAMIGQHLNNRTDNDVKNHFYSKIRKGLRKINYIVKDHFKKQVKEIKQTVLYKVIEGAEDRFNPAPIYDPDIWAYCTCKAKNFLLRMSYDEQEYNPWQIFQPHAKQIRHFIENLYHFSKDFQRKPKLKKIDQTPNDSDLSSSLHMSSIIHKKNISYHNGQSVCDSDVESSQFDESQSPQIQTKTKHNNEPSKMILHPNFTDSKQQNTIQLPPMLPRKIQKVNPVIILKSSNQLNEMMMDDKSSPESTKRNVDKIQKEQKNSKQTQSLIMPIPKLTHISSKASNAMIDEEEEDLNIRPEKSIESQLEQDGILQEEEEKNSRQFFLFNASGSRKIASKDSNFSSYSMEEEQSHFFEQDKMLNMRIFTTGVGGKMHHEMNESIGNSDKLFKSLDRSGKLFQSLDSRGKMDLEMSIEKSGDLKSSNFLAQSVGK